LNLPSQIPIGSWVSSLASHQLTWKPKAISFNHHQYLASTSSLAR
jgi:hypothetical protein